MSPPDSPNKYNMSGTMHKCYQWSHYGGKGLISDFEGIGRSTELTSNFNASKTA